MTMVGDENEDEIIEAILDRIKNTTEDQWAAIIDRLRASEKEKAARRKEQMDKCRLSFLTESKPIKPL